MPFLTDDLSYEDRLHVKIIWESISSFQFVHCTDHRYIYIKSKLSVSLTKQFGGGHKAGQYYLWDTGKQGMGAVHYTEQLFVPVFASFYFLWTWLIEIYSF